MTHYDAANEFGYYIGQQMSISNVMSHSEDLSKINEMTNCDEMSKINVANFSPNILCSIIRGLIEPTLRFNERGGCNNLSFKISHKLSNFCNNFLKHNNIQFNNDINSFLPNITEVNDFTDFSQNINYPPVNYYILGTEVLDLLTLLYNNTTIHNRCESIWNHYIQIYEEPQQLQIVREDKDAILPSKKRESDIGFDLTIIRKIKDFNSNTALYDTGLIIQPRIGYYVEIVPRSSLSKSGYIQTNSIGIIDPSYSDTLKIPLTKINLGVPDLIMPFTGFQLILRKHHRSIITECQHADLNCTSRGKGGFGSTGELNQHHQISPLNVVEQIADLQQQFVHTPPGGTVLQRSTENHSRCHSRSSSPSPITI